VVSVTKISMPKFVSASRPKPHGGSDKLASQLRLMASHTTTLLRHLSGATDQAGLLRDWQRARAALWTTMLLKLRYWDELPWKLCALAHENVHVVQKTAQQVLLLYDKAAETDTPGPGCLHRMTRRFCQKDYDGGADDPALRPLIERLASGEPYSDFLTDEKQPLAKWLSAFRHVFWHDGLGFV
ncbi:HERC2, partial [Symbiodinium microadriaticum]